jgi:hypothetical protein
MPDKNSRESRLFRDQPCRAAAGINLVAIQSGGLEVQCSRGGRNGAGRTDLGLGSGCIARPGCRLQPGAPARSQNARRWGVVQEACLRAFTFFGVYQAGDARTWVLKIMRNTSYTFVEKNRPAGSAMQPEL